MLTTEDVRNVTRMVLRDNMGQTLTEALCLGLEEAISFYCTRISDEAARAIELEKQHGA